MKSDADKWFQEARARTRGRIGRDGDGVSPEVARLLDVIGRRLYDPAFNVEELERSCRVTPRVRRLFRAELGATPKKYMTRRKLETGLWLLENTDLEVWMIAEDLGYTRTGNFSRDFKAWAKRTPMEVREAARPARSRILPGSVAPEFTPWCVAGSKSDSAHETLDGLPRKPKTRPLDWQPEDGAEAAARLLAASVWETLEGLPPEEQTELVRTGLRLDSPALFELLSEKSRELGRRDRQRGVELAELALASVEACAEALGDRAVELRALGCARLANALRLASDLKEADRAMARAEREWAAPRQDRDHRVEAEILALEGTLRQHQRRFGKALDLLNESIALCRVFGRERLLIQTLLKRVALLIYMGKAEVTLGDLRDVMRRLEGRGEPFLELCVVHALALVWTLVGDFQRGEDFVAQAKDLCEQLDVPSNRHQLEWIEGLICKGRGDPRGAEALFRKAQAGFSHLGEMDSAGVATMELALLCHEQRRCSEVLSLASEVIPVFEILEAYPEAATTARLLRESITARSVSEALLKKVRDLLWRIHYDPGHRDLFCGGSVALDPP